MYQHYGSIRELLFAIKDNNPISCVRTKENNYKAIIQLSNKCKTQAITLQFVRIFMNELMCMNYHEIVVNKTLTDDELEKFDDNEIKDYMICLSCLRDKNEEKEYGNKNLYSIFDHKWMEVNDKCEVMIPQ